MRRRDEDGANPGRDGVDDDALGVDRHGDDVESHRRQQGTRRRVARVLHGDPVAGFEQHATTMSMACWKPLVTTTSSAVARTAREHRHVAGDGRTQCRVARRLAVQGPADPRLT